MRKTIDILVFAFLLLLIPVFANAAIIDGGECGSGVTWTLDDTGLLVISGSGNMTDSPWQETHQLDIKQVVINQGIKNISERAFNWCKNLENVAIPDSVTVIGGYSFN